MKPTNSSSENAHSQAMHLAELALLEEKANNIDQARLLYTKAFELEQEAAISLVNNFELEPSRSIFFRSAAYLALKACLYREAERMAAFGLSGNPPDEIAIELRDVFTKSVQYLKKVA